MLGAVADAEDALQETLLAAWRGLAGFEGRSALRTWLYSIGTHACLRLISRRPRRLLSPELGPPWEQTADLGEPTHEPVWLEPWLEDEVAESDREVNPEVRFLRRESIELAFVAALQHLPGTQRAVLILREVLGFSAAEAARMLATTPVSVNSALQRARRTLGDRLPATSQRSELAALGDEGQRRLVDAFVGAWESADLTALLDLLTEDARFSMPPLHAWFDGREAVGRFFAERVFATPWRLVPRRSNGQLGFACYLRQPAAASLDGAEPGAVQYRLGAVNLLALRSGRIAEIVGFLDPELHRRLGVPTELAGDVLDLHR
jgi:RNA polymerase sigma-70 factor (ECF subfamily)